MRPAGFVLAASLVLATPAVADGPDKLFGTWKVLSAVAEDAQTREKTPLYGEHPRGYLIVLPNGRMMALLVSEDRKRAQDRRGKSRRLSFHGRLYGQIYR